MAHRVSRSVLRDREYEVLEVLTDELERAREIAARMDNTTVAALAHSNRSSEVAMSLRRLQGHGFVERDYEPEGTACVWRISETGKRFRATHFSRLMAQAV